MTSIYLNAKVLQRSWEDYSVRITKGKEYLSSCYYIINSIVMLYEETSNFR